LRKGDREARPTQTERYGDHRTARGDVKRERDAEALISISAVGEGGGGGGQH